MSSKAKKRVFAIVRSQQVRVFGFRWQHCVLATARPSVVTDAASYDAAISAIHMTVLAKFRTDRPCISPSGAVNGVTPPGEELYQENVKLMSAAFFLIG